MRTGSRGERILGMAGPRRHLSVDLELDTDSLSGTVSGDGKAGEPFHNWLELMSAVEGRRPEAGMRRSGEAEPGPQEASTTNKENER